MHIEHIAIYCTDLEKMKDFYCKYFNGISNVKYHNPKKQFSSYFISFEEGARLELMHKPHLADNMNELLDEYRGLIHFAVSVGSKEKVDALTEQLRADGYAIHGEPRTTGDGYYESVVADPEYNRVEITE